jgi:hypothetical protein
MTESVLDQTFDDHAAELTPGERERMADALEALAARVRVDPPARGGVHREFDGVDRWVILAVWP